MSLVKEFKIISIKRVFTSVEKWNGDYYHHFNFNDIERGYYDISFYTDKTGQIYDLVVKRLEKPKK